MKSKVVINIKDGLLEVTGSEKFVKNIYDDFKNKLGNFDNKKPVKDPLKNNQDDFKVSPRKSSSSGKIKKQTVNIDVNPELEVTGLESFFDKFEPKTDAEKTLIFVKFLHEARDISPCSASDIHTCFFALKEHLKVPTNYNSLLLNDSSRTKFFNRNGTNDITITPIGENHFNHKLKRKTND